jgi:small subunit ribosomal protein S1
MPLFSPDSPDNETPGAGLSASDAAAAEAAMNAVLSEPEKQKHRQEKSVTPVGGAKPASLRGPRIVKASREHRNGRVVSVGDTDIFVEFGPKELAVVPRNQWKEGETPPAVGSQLELIVDKFEAGENIFVCSRPGVVQKADWEMLEPGQIVDAKVTGVSKGGLECEVANHRGFIPASQVSLERIDNFEPFVGEKPTCKVIRVDRSGGGNIVLSRRELLNEDRKRQAEEAKKLLSENQIIEGTVRKIMPFGAFVDIGGVDGLIHISDLTYDRVGFGEKFVAKYVEEGKKVRVQILKLDWENDRISLGMKQVMGDPFSTAVNNIVEGAEVTGRVVRLAEFGAFVELAPGVEGLVHISEIDHRRITSVGEALKQDEVITAKVLKLDPAQRRFSLSIKALKPLPEIAIGAGGAGGPGDKKGKKGPPARTVEQINEVSPALRRAREKAKQMQLKGGLK